jgi:predicted dehydrogenase
MKTFKAIIAGLGNRGPLWVNQLKAREDCAIAAYVEPSAPNREKAIARGIPENLLFPSLEDAIKNVEADFVVDVTPPRVHHLVAEQAFAAGLDLLEEKPLSDNFETARKVVGLGRQSNRKHMVTQNYRFTAFPRTTRQVLKDGLIGKPGQCDVRFYMPWADLPGTHYVSEPYMLINDMMVHHFDLLRYVLDADPVSVQAITWNQPWGWHKGDAAHAIVFEYADGLVATHVSCGCAVGSQTSWNGDWRIEGPEGSIQWEKTAMWYSHLHRTESREHREIFPLSVAPSEAAILEEFLTSLRENRQPECNAPDNLKSLAMVFAAIRSAEEKRKVLLEEIVDGG